MRTLLVATVLWMLGWNLTMQAASRQHVIAFGKSASVKLFVGNNENSPLPITVRPLYMDGKLKEFTTGEAHDITDHQFVVQRAFRVNDSLPTDERTIPKWRWQRGGWLLVDRIQGRISPIRLAEFDAFYSEVSWYRDYAAYCGLSDAGDKLYAVVMQLGVHKPMAYSPLVSISGAETESECLRPEWQRTPTRVTFRLKNGHTVTFNVRGRVADLSSNETPAGDEESK